MSASKLLISGSANSGKTTLISKLDKALVIVTDNKTFPYEVPHYRSGKFNGVDAFKAQLVDKLKGYKAKYGERPQTVVFDSITHLYQDMHVWAQTNHKGFDVFNAMQTSTIAINDIMEDLLIRNNVNVVITAHTNFNEGSMSFDIPAMGKFKDSGGWLALVDNATHISTEHNRRTLYHASLKYPARTTVGMPEKSKIEDYDIQEHIESLNKANGDSDDFAI